MNRRDKTLSKLNSYSAKTLWLLFNYIKDKNTMEFYYSITTLQELTGYTRPSIIKGIKELEDNKIIKCKRQHGYCNIYKLLKPYTITVDDMTSKIDLPVDNSNQEKDPTSKTILPDQLNNFTTPVKPFYQTSKIDLPNPISYPKTIQESIPPTNKVLGTSTREAAKNDSIDSEIDSQNIKEEIKTHDENGRYRSAWQNNFDGDNGKHHPPVGNTELDDFKHILTFPRDTQLILIKRLDAEKQARFYEFVKGENDA